MSGPKLSWPGISNFLGDRSPQHLDVYNIGERTPKISIRVMAVPSQLQLSNSDVASLAVIGVYILIIGVMWHAPVLKNILYPFKACSASSLPLPSPKVLPCHANAPLGRSS